MSRQSIILKLLLTAAMFCGCKKQISVPEPVNSITTSEVFSSDATATSAVLAIYATLTNGPSYVNGLSSISLAQSADEASFFGGVSVLETNQLLSDGTTLAYWRSPYFTIYQANAILEGLNASAAVSPDVKAQLMGEAKFFRAFAHFYLINLFGDVPLLTSTSWSNNAIASRTGTSAVYDQVVADLLDAQKLLKDSYLKVDNTAYASVSAAEKVRVNKLCATALLARVYLYKGDYTNAEIQASAVINSGNYSLTTPLANVFKRNSAETILQMLPITTGNPYTAYEGNIFIPTNATSNPSYYLTASLKNAFEANDQRKTSWVTTTTVGTTSYSCPYKYQTKTGTAGTTPAEYIMVLRLAEQYLIRAEARAGLNNTSGAISDLNVVRSRAGLAALSAALSNAQVVTAVAQERRIELFCENGHRWFDLKRTGQADAVLGVLKPTWQPTAKLFPIPNSEILTNPKLVQNPGYQ